jgi:2-polyprenyl-6-methoxyphenol hydroxylase-like FAD-dependent oxidoreductase
MTGTAVVVGGGPGGLAAAAGLHRAGWQVTVLEQAPGLEPVGAAISLWPNALRALDFLGAGAAVRALAVPAGPGGVRRPDGAWLARSNVGAAVLARFGDPLVLVHRARLAEALAGVLPAGAVRTGCRVSGVEPGGDAGGAVLQSTEGGIGADLVVAADGLRSRLRAELFPAHPGPRHAGYSAWRAVLAVPAGAAVAGASETWGPDGKRFGIVPIAEGRLYCYATVAGPERAAFAPATSLAELRAEFGDWHAPIPAILADLTADQVLHHDVAELAQPLPSYRRGRVVLLGDAAHAMTPDLGQGGCQAVEDGAVLGACVAALSGGAWGPDHPRPRDLGEALAAYDALRRPRTTDIARRSRRAGRLYLAPAGLQQVAARVMGLLPDAAIARGLASVVDWRPPGQAPPPDSARPDPPRADPG